jgi:hypothetical protein
VGDSDRHCRFDRANGGRKAMRLDTVDTRSSQSDLRISQDNNNRQSLMKPARRAALDAMEREFHDFLKSPPR